MPLFGDWKFYFQGIKILYEAWKKFEVVFGKHNEIWAHHLKNKLFAWNLNELSYTRGGWGQGVSTLILKEIK